VINDLWYKNAIIYCLSFGTYMDANGQGIGDFIVRVSPPGDYAILNSNHIPDGTRSRRNASE